MNDWVMRAVRRFGYELARARQQQVQKQNVLLREIHFARALYCCNKLLFAVRVNCHLFIRWRRSLGFNTALQITDLHYWALILSELCDGG